LEARDIGGLNHLYHLSSQAISVALWPVGLIGIVFPGLVAFAWTGEEQIVREFSTVLPLLMAGTVLLASNCAPNAMALAAGRADIPLCVNLASLIGIPVAYVLMQRFGTLGATATWVVAGIVNVVLMPTLLARSVLPGAWLRWWFVDLGLPLATSLGLAMGLGLLSFPGGRIGAFFELGTIWVCLTAAAAFSAPDVRREILKGAAVAARLIR
ncbi:MAG: hypothetical protein J0H62_04260, partial [Rhizobiales bacterium]|nr:hypothetical protein [Hyphomicrobiales bacterium]